MSAERRLEMFARLRQLAPMVKAHPTQIVVRERVIRLQLKRATKGGALPSARTLRWVNELPVFVLLAIIYLVLAKPF